MWNWCMGAGGGGFGGLRWTILYAKRDGERWRTRDWTGDGGAGGSEVGEVRWCLRVLSKKSRFLTPKGIRNDKMVGAEQPARDASTLLRTGYGAPVDFRHSNRPTLAAEGFHRDSRISILHLACAARRFGFPFPFAASRSPNPPMAIGS